MFLFYATLQGLVRESAARAPVQASIPAAFVQPPVTSDREEAARPVRPAALPVASLVPLEGAPVEPPRVATPTVKVTKCIGPSGEAEYSDGPCSNGGLATTLRLQ
ncbi:hypothetical protein ACCC97_20100 [Variovorax sp. Varisp85]|jgi:hypothetical protein|uniref:hypothetical protein n=1 Tax=unclassified Variovorax TaxID=663243 RepID=UPI000678926F|nr:hypothetical protein [Variovorax sp. CF313]